MYSQALRAGHVLMHVNYIMYFAICPFVIAPLGLMSFGEWDIFKHSNPINNAVPMYYYPPIVFLLFLPMPLVRGLFLPMPLVRGLFVCKPYYDDPIAMYV